MNKPGLIIGISGKIGSGKDTVAREIMKAFPEYSFNRKSFGYNVKKTVGLLTGIDLRTILSRKIKSEYISEWGMTVGELFQCVGNGLREKTKDDAWIYSLFNNVKNEENIIITDVRYLNEAESILNRGGYLIRLKGDPKEVGKNDKRSITHVSEIELDNFDKFDIVYENVPPIENIQMLIKNIKNKFNL
jgi:ABC-type dipeptide/oligopeptide/nickel transport system ATPase component